MVIRVNLRNTKYFAAFPAVILAIGQKPPATNAHSLNLLSSMFNDVLVQCSVHHLNQPRGLIPPPDRGAPDRRSGAASRARQRLMHSQKFTAVKPEMAHTREEQLFKL
jgi:hypothetical protein